MTMQITIEADTPELFDRMMNSIASATTGPGLKKVLQEIVQMSQTLESQIAASNAANAAGLARLQANLTAIASQLAASVPAVGSVVTQADVDAANANAAALANLVGITNSMVATPTPVPAPTPST